MKLSRKETLLTQSRLKEVLNYNEKTGEFVWIAKTGTTGVSRIGQTAGCLNNLNRYRQIKIDGNYHHAHRLVWLYVYGYFPRGEKPQLDHVDGNRDNNRVENLKQVSQGENCKNTRMKSNNTSGITGIRREGMSNNSKTKPKINWYWRAYWHNEKSEQKRISFSIEKLGETVAKNSAIAYRAEQIRLLEIEHGIVYSERHGY